MSPVTAPSPEQLAAALNDEFARLGIEPAKVAAKAPSGQANFVFDLSGNVIDPDGGGPINPTMVALRWTERAVGDYDQNGEVNLSDITPLGMRFLQTASYAAPVGPVTWWPQGQPDDDGGAGAGNPPAAGSGAENWRLARIDGDGNGELNLADLTPLATHWQERLDGFRIYRRDPGSPDFLWLPNPGDAGSQVTIARPAVDPTRPVIYVFQDVPPGVGVYEYYVVPVDANIPAEGAESNHISLNYVNGGGPGNQPPTAVLVGNPASGPAPLNVTWNASGSFDLDGNITDYTWDVDGNGTWDHSTGLTSSETSTFSNFGPATVGVQVTDNQGGTDTAYATVNVTSGHEAPTALLVSNPPSGPAPLTVTWDASASTDPDNNITEYRWDRDGNGTHEWSSGTGTLQETYQNVGMYSMSVIVRDATGLDSAPATATVTVTQGAAFWHNYDVDSSHWGSGQARLAEIAGAPGIAYYDKQRKMMMYVRAVDAKGTAWGAPLDVTGGYIPASLQEVNGRPAVALTHPVNAYLANIAYMRALDAQGANWVGAPIIQIDSGGDVLSWEATMLVVNGRPAIAWYDLSSSVINPAGPVSFYIRSTDADGASWGTKVQLPATGRNMALGIVDGRPAIMMNDGGLRYLRASDANGDGPAAWTLEGGINVPVVSGAISNHGFGVAGGMPAAAYMDVWLAQPEIKFVGASDATGSAWNLAKSVLALGSTNIIPISLLTVGNPLVVFLDEPDRELKSVRASDATGSAWDAPTTIRSQILVGPVDLSGAEIDGCPAVAYTDSSGYVKYAAFF